VLSLVDIEVLSLVDIVPSDVKELDTKRRQAHSSTFELLLDIVRETFSTHRFRIKKTEDKEPKGLDLVRTGHFF
jgi:hypothetical protein